MVQKLVIGQNMLFRMYTKWADRNDFQIEIDKHMLDGDEAIGLVNLLQYKSMAENACWLFKNQKREFIDLLEHLL